MRLIQALKKNSRHRGMTFIELVVAIAVTSIIMLGTVSILADSQKGWWKMYNKINAEAVRDAYMARGRFESVVRKSSILKVLIDEDAGQWVEVYYPDEAGGITNRYGNFYVSDGALNFEYGVIEPRETLGNEVICENVESCFFKRDDKSVQMILTLNDGENNNKMVCSAYLHNR
jgi:prepilin-type N-terminal cleavage/methylation domain-containing protein